MVLHAGRLTQPIQGRLSVLYSCLFQRTDEIQQACPSPNNSTAPGKSASGADVTPTYFYSSKWPMLALV